MKDNYDFSDAIKNPFAGKIKGKYVVTIHYDFAENSKIQHDTETDNAYFDKKERVYAETT